MSVDNVKQINLQNPVKNQKRFIPKPYQDIAQSMEKQFIEHMLDQMGKTVPGQGDKDSATKYYESILKSERANLMAKNNGGIGIQEMILNKIYPQRNATTRSINAFKRNSQDALSKEIIATSINDSVNNFDEVKTSQTSKEDSNE